MAHRKCIICGARVRNQNPKTVTCSRLCTEQKNTGKTLEQLTREASQIPNEAELDTFASEFKRFQETNHYA